MTDTAHQGAAPGFKTDHPFPTGVLDRVDQCREIEVAAAQRAGEFRPGRGSLIDTLLDAGHLVSFSCREGVCGSCETTVLEGTPDHRDFVLSPAEREAGKTMMICVSGCKSPRLVLDL